CSLEALPLILVNDALEVLLLHQLLTFGDFENDPVGGEVKTPGRLQCGPNARSRLIHRIGQEVDAQQAGHLQAGRPLHRFHPAGLIERIAVLLVDPPQHAGRAAAVYAAHQCLIGKQALIAQIDDRLEGNAEIKVQRVTLSAMDAGGNRKMFIHARASIQKEFLSRLGGTEQLSPRSVPTENLYTAIDLYKIIYILNIPVQDNQRV